MTDISKNQTESASRPSCPPTTDITPVKKAPRSKTLAKIFRGLRVALAAIFFVLFTALFIDPTTSWAKSLGFVARMQFFPAVLALNVLFVGAILASALILGRVYCSVLCPLGIFQDLVSRVSSMGNKSQRRLRFSFRAPWTKTKWIIFAAFLALALLGLTSLAAMIEPYSTWGRISGNLFNPLIRWVNNRFADVAATKESYAFIHSEIFLKSFTAILLALVELTLVSAFAWKKGRLWCNAVCPIGTLLGLVSRFALIRPRFDATKCVKCRLCERGCRASCIDVSQGIVDASRCVDCLDCAANCPVGAIQFTWGAMKPSGGLAVQKNMDPSALTPKSPASAKEVPLDPDKRALVLAVGTAAGTLALNSKAYAKETDGGLAPLKPREAPQRSLPVLPPGSQSLRNMAQRCIGCHLCVASCPNNVIAPSKDPKRWMQPELAFHRSRCRPECHRCSRVCPTGAIQKVSKEDKVSLKIGTALWNADLCLASQGKYACGNCARHCPAGAIHMGKLTGADDKAFPVPMVDSERCIGCGACEQLCPVRPVSAIVVHGVDVQRMV